MRHILMWLAVLCFVAVALSAEVPVLKHKGAAVEAGGDLKTASSFIGPIGYGYGWGWGFPYWGYAGWGYPYWG